MVLILISCTKEIRLFLSLILMMYMVDIYVIISYMINLSFFLRSLKKRLEKEAFGLYLSIKQFIFLPIDIDKIIWYVMMADVLCLNKLGFCLFFGI